MTPGNVVHLTIALVLDRGDRFFSANPGLIRTLYDTTFGMGVF
jgi:hypothetical protein